MTCISGKAEIQKLLLQYNTKYDLLVEKDNAYTCMCWKVSEIEVTKGKCNSIDQY